MAGYAPLFIFGLGFVGVLSLIVWCMVMAVRLGFELLKAVGAMLDQQVQVRVRSTL